jgi:DUF917 family protein
MEIKSLEECQKFVTGATIMGTGGGGSGKEGLELLKEIIDSGKTIEILPLDSLPNDSIVAVPYFVGSVAPGVDRKKIQAKVDNPIRVATSQLEETLGKKITAFAATELGGLNTSVALYISAQLGLPMVDGDLLGRAGPELHQCTAHLFDIPMSPSAIVTKTGNIVIVKSYGSIDDYEATARHQSIIAGRSATVVDTPMTLEQAKKAVLPGTVSLCYKLGGAVREARLKREDPVESAVKTLAGWRFFQGRVSKFKWSNEGGFLKAKLFLEGTGKSKGRRLKSWIMNEHIMVWLDGRPVVMPPDLMALLKSDGEAVTNGELKVGMKLTAIAAKAPTVWRTQRGLELFGPRRFGFHYSYKPVEKLLARS